MSHIKSKFSLAVLTAIAVLSATATLHAQSRQQVKVLVEFRQASNEGQDSVTGSGSVVITRRGAVQPSGRLRAGETQTTVQRSAGIFTVVQDAGESILSVATRVPYRQVLFFRDYATGAGYVASSVLFNDVGTSLIVSANILTGNQIRVRLTPRISYFSTDRSGAIDFTEASTELVVPSGHPVVLGGATTQMHEVTRHIFGFGERHIAGGETTLVLTATIQ